jgi:hypothetical protein
LASIGNREPLTAAGIYQMIARAAAGRPESTSTRTGSGTISHTWLDRGGLECDLMELNA